MPRCAGTVVVVVVVGGVGTIENSLLARQHHVVPLAGDALDLGVASAASRPRSRGVLVLLLQHREVVPGLVHLAGLREVRARREHEQEQERDAEHGEQRDARRRV